ncbi:hypothetical protein [Azospirillum halopraeferens]|uniref:hypothetical protein n=1 Tax=Azospirillum halopraeferens TaxID=34010 RepID=UPI00048F3460|nr:hypothetical protein [Azospirillum halopraeferens]
MSTAAFVTMPASVRTVIDAAHIDLFDDEECLDVIFEASCSVEPGSRAEALEWAAAYLDMLRSRAVAAGAHRRTATPADLRFRSFEGAPC